MKAILVFPRKCCCCEDALESTETMEWKAFAAILNFICPLFGRGLLSWKLLPNAAAVTTLTLLFMVETEGLGD